MSDAYAASPWQAKFHSLTQHEALGAGAAGPGKTSCLLAEPLQYQAIEMARLTGDPRSAGFAPRSPWWDLITQNPIDEGTSIAECLYLRRTFPQLEQTIDKARRLYRVFDPHVEYNGEAHTFRFPATGLKVKFGHCHKGSDWENYMSNEYVWIGFDELVQFEQNQYEQIKNRCRTTDPVLKRLLKIRAMSNPVMRSEGADSLVLEDPQWVRRYFVDVYHQEGKEYGETIEKTERDREGKEFKRTRVYLPAKLSDNPNKEFVAMETEKLMHALPHIRKALLEGDWYVVHGAFFSDIWDPSIHVFRAFRIPKGWPVFRSMDWGYKTNGVIGWFAVDPDGNLLCMKDLVFRLKHPEQVAEDIEAIEKALGIPWQNGRSRITGPADTQLWEERGEKGLSKAAEFEAAGVNWVQADKKSRRRNAERVSTRLADHEGGTTYPGLSYASVCLACIQCIPAIGTDPNDPETPMKGGNDHPYDMSAYAVAYASHGLPSLTAPSDEDEDDQVDDGPTGQYGYGAH
jgi:hypothetical protein